MQDASSSRTLYRTAKIIHLAGLILWLGPSAGGYILLMLARLRGGAAEALPMLPGYIALVDVEAAGLTVLILSGLALRQLRPAYKEALWLKRKLLIVQYVFIPLEVVNLYICHSVLSGALEGRQGVLRAFHIYDRFSVISAVFLLVSVPAVFILAVFKPWGQKN